MQDSLSDFRPATLKDVARIANVSVAAASLALSDASQISEGTKDRVRRASAQINYRPLRRRVVKPSRPESRPTRRIALVLVSPYDAADSMQLFERLDRLGVTLKLRLELAVVSETDAPSQRRRLEQAVRGVEGVLLVGYVTHDLLAHAASLGPPCVLMGAVEGDPARPRPACCIVASDVLAMGYLATGALLRAGHKRIAYFCREMPLGLWYERWHAGYRYAHLDAGVPLDGRLTVVAGMEDQDESVGVIAARAMRNLGQPATGFVLPDPFIASTFVSEMKAAGQPLALASLVYASHFGDMATLGQLAYPTISENSPLITRMTMRVLRQAADGKSSWPCTISPPFETSNFEAFDEARVGGTHR